MLSNGIHIGRRGGVQLGGGGELLPFTDDFNRADGALSNGWEGATWAIDGNKAVNTPTLGGELFTNPNFTAWTGDNPDGWTVVESLPNNDVSEVGSGESYGGTGTGACNIRRTIAAGVSIAQNVLLINRWYQFAGTLSVGTGGLSVNTGTSVNIINSWSATDSVTFRAPANTTFLISGRSLSTNATIDDVTIKEVTLSSLIATQNFGLSDVNVSVKTTLATGRQGGVIANLDNPSNPQNFVLGYYDRISGSAKLDKCVGGTWTNLLNVSVTYSAAAVVRVVKTGATIFQLHYGGSQRGANQTVSDAGIVNNTVHGIFSTAATNSLDDFSCTAAA